MSTSQEALADAEHNLKAAWDGGRMVDMMEALRALDACRVAMWEHGGCCGQRYSADTNRCACALVCLRRGLALAERGMGASSVAVMREICEHSEASSDIEVAYRLIGDIGPRGVRVADVAVSVLSEEG